LARGLLRQLLGSPAPGFQQALLRDQSLLADTTTPRGYLHLCSVLTFYDAGLWQCSPHG
jgi:hypothetical protein